MKAIQQAYSDTPTILSRKKGKEVKLNYDLWQANLKKMKADQLTLQYDKYGNIVGRLLVHLIRGAQKLT